MTDRPIIFSPPSVRALLAGTKNQTRRLLKPHYLRFFDGVGRRWRPSSEQLAQALTDVEGMRRFDAGCLTWLGRAYAHQAPLTQARWMAWVTPAVGDRLWVKEAWQTGMGDDGPQLTYRATPDCFDIDAWDGNDEGAGPSFNYDKCPDAEWASWLPDVRANDGPWRNSMYQPRWASRITLTVTDVRVQRLQEITEEDARAEGVVPFLGGGWIFGEEHSGPTPRSAYAALWNTLHRKAGTTWADNPWIVAVSFSARPTNIDRREAP